MYIIIPTFKKKKTVLLISFGRLPTLFLEIVMVLKKTN